MQARRIVVSTLASALVGATLSAQVPASEIDAHINDAAFARATAEAFLELMSG